MKELLHFPDNLRLMAFFALLALVPFVLVLMTSFTRISIILTFLRQALSTTVPSSHIIIGLSLILTGYVMHPVIIEINDSALKPYLAHTLTPSAGQSEEQAFFEKAWPPLRHFMLKHTREKDLALFMDVGDVHIEKAEELAWYTVIPAFVISELRTAFMMGFLLFLPFLIVDLVITSLLMSLGMIMLPPVLISFPFKLLLFVVVDGWHLVTEQVINGYGGLAR